MNDLFWESIICMNDPTIPFHHFGGQGTVLHFAHANGYPPACYRQFVAPLLNHYQVLGLKHRALWPEASLSLAQGWQQSADDLIRFLDQQGLCGIVGLGHSLGAVATMYAALKRPDLFSALILIEPVFLPPYFVFLAHLMPYSWRQRLNPMVRTAQRRRDTWPNKQAMFDHFRPKPVFAGVSDGVLWDFVNHGSIMEEGQVRLAYSKEWEAYFYATPPKVWQPLSQVMHPMMGIRGATSTTVSTAAWRRWQRMKPQATLIEVPEAGHLVPFEQPARLAAHILAYLKNDYLDSPLE